MGIIYKIVNDINGKVYIGQTNFTAKRRFHEHCRKAREGSNTKLHRAIRKFGEEHFHSEMIDEYEDKELDIQEKYWIQIFNSFNNGYNATLGGASPREVVAFDKDSKEYVASFLSVADASQFVIETGRTTSTKIGSCRSPICDCCSNKDNHYSLYGLIWKYKTDLPKTWKVGDKLPVFLYPKYNKKFVPKTSVAMVSVETNKVEKIFDSSYDAAKFLVENSIANSKIHTVAGGIRKAANGHQKTAYGYRWKNIKEE